MTPPKSVKCPVGEHAEIGYLAKDQVTSLICRDCMFTFTWDKNGKLRPPEKLIIQKPPQKCGCLVCEARDDARFYRPNPQLPPPYRPA